MKCFHKDWEKYAERKLLFLILERQGQIMAAIDSLKTAVTDVSTAISQISADVQTALGLLQNSGSATDADVQAAADALETVAKGLDTVDAQLKAAIAGKPLAKPVIGEFSTAPTSIALGASSTLSWTVVGATSLAIDNGVGDMTGKSSVSVSPTATTIYTLSATNAAGTVSQVVTVTVS